jgi:hypothetical protein
MCEVCGGEAVAECFDPDGLPLCAECDVLTPAERVEASMRSMLARLGIRVTRWSRVD